MAAELKEKGVSDPEIESLVEGSSRPTATAIRTITGAGGRGASLRGRSGTSGP